MVRHQRSQNLSLSSLSEYATVKDLERVRELIRQAKKSIIRM